jgi:serine O-acetyltransferase
MTPDSLPSLRAKLARLWFFSPEKLWLLSIALQRRGHWVLAFSVKQFNTCLYHNSLSAEVSVNSDVRLGHYSHGIVVGSKVVIGRGVKIWQNVTLTAGRPPRAGEVRHSPARIILEDFVHIGANAVVIAPRGRTVRIGRGARIGAGTVITCDVPARATVVAPAPRVLTGEPTAEETIAEEAIEEEAIEEEAIEDEEATAAELTAAETSERPSQAGRSL